MAPTVGPPTAGHDQKGFAMTMTVDTLAPEALSATPDTPEAVVPSSDNIAPEKAPTPDVTASDAPAKEKPKKAPAKKAPAKRAKTLELTLTVTGTPDGDWRAELKHGTTYLARNLTVAAAAVSRAAKELHEDLSSPIEDMIEEARSQQAARVAALEAELEAARKVLAELD
jgi:hypothetical protein